MKNLINLAVVLVTIPVIAQGYDFTVEAGEDTYVNEQPEHVDDNYGHEPDMRAGNLGHDPESEHILYVYFDLSEYEWDQFCRAELEVWCTENRQTHHYDLYKVHMDELPWTEEGITWNNKPDWIPGPISEIEIPYIDGGGQWTTFDATDAVWSWRFAENRGLCIIQNGTDLGIFSTKEVGKAPRLHIWEDAGTGTGTEEVSLGTIKAMFK